MSKKKPKAAAKVAPRRRSTGLETWKTWVILAIIALTIVGFMVATLVSFNRKDNIVECAREMALFEKALAATREAGDGLFPAAGANFGAVLSQLESLRKRGSGAIVKNENGRLEIPVTGAAPSGSAKFIPFLPEKFACPSGGTYSLLYPSHPKTPDEAIIVCSKHGAIGPTRTVGDYFFTGDDFAFPRSYVKSDYLAAISLRRVPTLSGQNIHLVPLAVPDELSNSTPSQAELLSRL